MANKFLKRSVRLSPDSNEDENNFVPRQRGLGRRIFEGIAKKKKKKLSEESDKYYGEDLSE